MDDKAVDLTSFNGIAGRVLMGALSVEALITGLFMVGFLWAAQFGLARIGQGNLIYLVAGLLASIVLTRFALNGRVGERRGFLFSGEGGSLGDVFTVGLRFMALWVLWIVPLEAVGLTPTKVPATLMTMSTGQADVGTMTMTLAVVLFMAACPALFLILAVGSPGFLDIFVPTRWGALFRGRLSELFSIYVLHLGALGVVSIITAPVVFAGGMIHPQVGTILNWVAAAVAVGVAMDLLGRLCGFFVLTGGADWTKTQAAEPDLPVTRGSDLAPVVAGSAAVSGAPGAINLPELKNARERIQDIVEGLSVDPDRALVELEDLNSRYTPHPLVLHSLCLLYERCGRREASIRIAPHALSVCREQGTDRLVAEVFATRIDMAAEFGLEQGTILRLAEALLSHGDMSRAETVYRMLLEQNPGDRYAIKGLLKVGEGCLRQNTDPERARMIYAYLLEIAEDSPLAKFMRDGLAEANRRLAA